VLCAGSTLLLVEDALTSYRKRRPCWSVTKLASITFLSLAFSYWTDKPWFLTEGKLLLCSSYLPLGVPNWSVIYISIGAIKPFSGAVAREEEDFCKGSFTRTSFTLFIVLLYFIFACIIFIKNTKKN
jgi:hypothetical protein